VGNHTSQAIDANCGNGINRNRDKTSLRDYTEACNSETRHPLDTGYTHFTQAFEQLKDAVELADQRDLSELEEQGMIQAFEYTHELAWNTLKDFLEHQGLQNLYGSKDSSREAFKKGLIKNGEVWMDMIKSRNLSSHTYNRDIAEKIVYAIRKNYCHEFQELISTLKPLVRETE
jgi:nucleotidyltransferase substrate binding protein (TIGR01987 family)